MKPRKRLSIQEVYELYTRFESTGLSLAEFARQEDIPYTRLIHYKRRLSQADILLSTSKSQHFLQLFPSPSSSQPSNKLLLRCSSVEIEIREGFNPRLLSQVLEVLKTNA